MRILIISHDVVGSSMAGPGIRALELARQIAVHHTATLIAPNEIDILAERVEFGAYAWGVRGTLDRFLDRADAIVANAYVLAVHPEIAETRCPLALDLYDPIALENAAYLTDAPLAERRTRQVEDTQLFRRQLEAGDFFFCATEVQRDLYLGALLAAGRLTPEVLDEDPSLRRLIDVVGFGLSVSSFQATGDEARQRLGIGIDDPVVLWTSGLWDWLDPLTLIEAAPAILREHPSAKIVFLAGRHPGDGREMKNVRLARDRAKALGLDGTAVLFYEEWIPYENRGTFFAAADLAICLHPEGLESHFAALRSRFLDHLWAALPSVVTQGDEAARIVTQEKIGVTVPPGDVTAVAEVVADLIRDAPARRTIATRIEAIRGGFTWPVVTTPLLAFCNEPRQRRDRVRQD